MKLTQSLKRRFTADWAECFPKLEVWSPMQLLRRCGPVLVGICLDRRSGGDAYVPTGHIHNLLRPFPVLALTLGKRVGEVRADSHERFFPSRIEELRGCCAFLEEQPLRLQTLLAAYEDHLQSGAPEAVFPQALYEEMVLLAAYESPEKGAKFLSRFVGVMSGWTDDVRATLEDVGAWEARLREAIEGDLTRVVQSEVARHDLSRLSDTGLSL